MVIDSSALVAILEDEPERAAFTDKIVADPIRLLSAANYLETAIVIDDRFGTRGERELRLFMLEAGITVVPVTVEHAELARAACRRFGRGYHPARLNFGDCFAYALAQDSGEPLLFKGRDFSQTDLGFA